MADPTLTIAESVEASPAQSRWIRIYSDRPFARSRLVFTAPAIVDREQLLEAIKRITAKHDALRVHLQEHFKGRRLRQNIVAEIPVVSVDGNVDTSIDLPDPNVRIHFRRIGESVRVALDFPGHSVDGISLSRIFSELRDALGRNTAFPDAGADALPYSLYSEAINQHSLENPWSLGSRYQPLPVLRLPGVTARSAGGDVGQILREIAFPETDTLDLSLESRLLTIWALVLCRASGQSRQMIGWWRSNREIDGVAKAIGRFEIVLPVVIDLDLEKSVSRASKEVRSVTNDVAANGESFVWERFAPELKKAGLEDHYRVLFSFCEDEHEEVTTADGWRVEERAWKTEPSWLELRCSRVGERLLLTLNFDKEIIPEGLSIQLMDAFVRALSSSLSAPERTMKFLDLVPESEQKEMSRAGDELHYDRIDDWILCACRRTPDRVAVETVTHALSFKALENKSRILASKLYSRGVRSGDRVGLVGSSGIASIVGILGILRAGAAYVPVISVGQVARVTEQLRAAGARWLVHGEDKIDELDGVELILALQDSPLDSSITNSCGGLSAAYIIFTSGSTGVPKGVVISHRSLIASTQRRAEYYERTPGRYLLSSPLSFDSSVAGLFWSLCEGGTLIIPSEAQRSNYKLLAEFISTRGCERFLGIPSLYRALLNEPQMLKSLCSATVAGECCASELLAVHSEQLPGTVLVNEYGPTEGCVWASAWKAEEVEEIDDVPIGRPVAAVHVDIFSAAVVELPDNWPGELCLSGSSLADGYIRLPRETAAKFVPHPRANGKRMYRTGDHGRWDSSGNLRFIGRLDHQVKIRGHRIELEEIENVLRRHPSVSDAVVLVDQHSGGSSLKAIVEAREDRFREQALRTYLENALPIYMVPARLLLVSRLPRTAHGKVDRKALEQERDLPILNEVDRKAPETATERRLADIWQRVLKKKSVGRNQGFLELGGHSLLAVPVVSQIDREFAISIPFKTLFESRTLAEVAAAIDLALLQATRTTDPGKECLPEPNENQLSFEQERMLYLHELDPKSPAYNMPIRLDFVGRLDPVALKQAFVALVSRHVVFRSNYYYDRGRPKMRFSPDESFEFEIHDSTPADAKSLDEQVRTEATRPFDLHHGPLLRVHLYQQRDRGCLLITVHHIAGDAWAMLVFQNELTQLYKAYINRQPPTLEPLRTTYAELVRNQRKRVSSGALDAQKTFWSKRLEAPLTPLNLPFDRAMASELSGRGRRATFSPSVDAMVALKATAATMMTTEYVVAMSVLSALLAHYGNWGREFGLGTLLPNRAAAGSESVIGFFANTVAIRAQVDPTETFYTLLERMKEQCYEAQQNQEIPFEEILRQLNRGRSAKVEALFSVLFLYLQTEVDENKLPGVEDIKVQVPDVGAAKFPLLLWLSRRGESGELAIEYSTDLWDPSTIERIAADYFAGIDALLAAPEKPLISLLP